ncbi:MAG: OsmC family protein [Planctomycetota bacterium]
MTTKILVKQIDGLALAAKAPSGHWVAMDGPEKLGGMDAGSRPMEVLLMALGGCTGMDVVSILRKKRAPVTDFVVEVEAERADEHPKVYTKIHVKYVVTGRGVKPADVERAIELSETTYCSITAMLRPNVEVTSSYEIREPSA